MVGVGAKLIIHFRINEKVSDSGRYYFNIIDTTNVAIDSTEVAKKELYNLSVQ